MLRGGAGTGVQASYTDTGPSFPDTESTHLQLNGERISVHFEEFPGCSRVKVLPDEMHSSHAHQAQLTCQKN